MPYFPPNNEAEKSPPSIQSETAPVNPAFKQYWIEVSSGGLFINEWFWNGTHWLSKQIIVLSCPLAFGASTSGSAGLTPFSNLNYNIFLIEYSLKLRIDSINNNTNYWNLNFVRFNNNGIPTNINGGSFSTINELPNVEIKTTLSINTFLDLNSIWVQYFGTNYTKVGTPGALRLAASFSYRLARV